MISELKENGLRMKKKVERRLDKIPDARYPEKVERRSDRIPDVRYLGGMLGGKNSRCETSGWNVGRGRIQDVRRPGGMSAEENSECETPEWNVGGEEFRI